MSTKKETTKDVNVRVPIKLKERYEAINNKGSWRSFAEFIRFCVVKEIDNQEFLASRGFSQ